MGSVWSEKDPHGNNGEYPLIWMLSMFEFCGNSEFFLSGMNALDIAEKYGNNATAEFLKANENE